MDGDNLYTIGEPARRTGLVLLRLGRGAAGGFAGRYCEPSPNADPTEVMMEKMGAARDSGIGPTTEQARPVVDEIVAAYAEAFGRVDDTAYRRSLLDRMEIANDPRVERYWQLLATINGWPAQPSLSPVFEWFITALRT